MLAREDARDDEEPDSARALRHFNEHIHRVPEKGGNVRSVVQLLLGTGIDCLLLPSVLVGSKRAARVHATWECRVHELIVHLSLILLPGYRSSRDDPAPFDGRYCVRDFGEALKSERTKSHLLTRLGNDVRCRRRVKSGEHVPTMLVDLYPRIKN
jgi:hypothetical protein